MKYIVIITAFFLLRIVVVAANTSSTPSATPVSKETQSKIDDLKERLATKVAELRKTSPKALFGAVTQVSLSSITVDATQKAFKIELTDDITVSEIIKGKRTSLKTDDVKKNDNVTIFGNYDETLDILQATHIFIEAAKLPVRLHGTISSINKKDNSFTLSGIDETNYVIDIESTTKNNIWSPEGGIEKGGFSKLEVGMYVTVVGFEDQKQTDRFSATRIVTFNIPGKENVKPSPTEKVSTPSATPRSRTTPSSRPTPKPTIEE